MTPERYQKIAELYQAAQELEPAQRSDFLGQACDGDESLKLEVIRLLASSEEAQNFLSSPAFVIAAEALADQKVNALIGRRLGRFEILSLLGAGGMGEVYLAEDAQLGRRVALKLLPQEFTSQAERLRRFEREARAASALNHPNIITIHDIGETDGIHFIATEYIEGDMLRRRIARGPLAVVEALDIAAQVAGALDVAHAAGIIHRDIKPENIMLRPDGYVKVLDFGLAKLTEPKEARPTTNSEIATLPVLNETTAGMIIGTVNYMSPEQARGLRVDSRSDLWSVGVTLYEMVSGRFPFTGETATDVILSIVDRSPRPFTDSAPGLPGELERIVMKALAKNRDERYQSAKDMAIDLKNLKRQLEMKAELAQPLPMAGAAPTREEAIQVADAVTDEKQAPVKKPGVSLAQIAIVSLLIVIAGLIGWYLFRPQPVAPVSAPASTSTPAPGVQAPPERQVTYWFTIVGSNNKTTVASEAQTFERTDRFSLNLSSPESGYLYLFNEEVGPGGEKKYSLLFPTQASAPIAGKEIFKTKTYHFSDTKKGGTENLLLVWAAQSVAELEALIKWYNATDKGVIKDSAQLESLKKFIEQHQQSTKQPAFDETSKQTTIQGSGEVLIHLIKLTHR